MRSGIPLPRDLNIRNTGSLTVVNASDTPVPAEFQVLARWNAGREDATAPIQWLLITFPASVRASGNAKYKLVLDGSAGPNPPPTVSVSVARNGNQVIVDTGAATFVLGGNANAFFDEIDRADGNRVVSGSTQTATIGNKTYNHSRIRSVRIEHTGKLCAIVVVKGKYGMPKKGGGALSSFRRYLFTAGSPTAIVRQAVNWEGDLCDSNGYDLTCEDGGVEVVNGLLLKRVRNAFTLDSSGPRDVMAVGSLGAAAVQGTVNSGQEAWVRQQLRARRTRPLSYDVNVPGTGGASGEKADGGMLAVSGAAGTFAVALNHMHRYEPQALRLLADGRVAVDVVDNRAWVGQRQGLFATMAFSVFSSKPTRRQLDRLVWAPLNRPLRAWPKPNWFADSRAVDEFPVGALPTYLASYDNLLRRTLSRTLWKVDRKGLGGLMTFGLYPRYWGTGMYGDELDCDGDDPTPGKSWDDAYWCGAWTDYHNTISAAPTWAMRTGEVEWLDEIAFPGALRVLHTQIMQSAPGDTYFYSGQAPSGYGGYRLNFNSSHAYFDNLFMYYWLTGDYTVVETIKRGASSMRDYLCFRRPQEPCRPRDRPNDYWAWLSGRSASQWIAVFRFVGLAGDDPGYLEDWRSSLARAVTQHYVLVKKNGVSYGFWTHGAEPINGPGRYATGQLWMVSLLDMNNLYRLQVETNDEPIGKPAVRPSKVLTTWARTLLKYGSTTVGNGTAEGLWPNGLFFKWSGARIGGTLISVTANTGGGDPYLYETGKACLTAILIRVANRTGNKAMRRLGRGLTKLTLNAIKSDGAPLGKIMGLYFSRLHAAVAGFVL